MTGFGKAIAEFPEKNVVIEIKSLNSKQMDINTRVSHVYREKELAIRNIISERLIRGKVDICIYYDYKDGANVRTINSTVVSSYISQLEKIAIEGGLSTDNLLETAMKLPDVLSNDTVVALTDEEWAITEKAVHEACDDITRFREEEGKSLLADITENITTIENCLSEILQFEGLRVERIRERILKNLEELVGADKIDNNRLEQEMIFYVEKLDINEEKVRLTQHCLFFRETLEQDASGKKLGFISQEIGREINTIGSKSNDADMQRLVVQMKDCLERIKEQVLNIQ